jgi:hypothetical protein
MGTDGNSDIEMTMMVVVMVVVVGDVVCGLCLGWTSE